MRVTSKVIIEKQSGEVLNVSMDFTDYVSNSSVTISSPTVTSYPASLTLTSPVVSGLSVTFTVSGGVDGQNYRIECTIDTSDGETLIGDGLLKVRDI